MLKLRSTVLTGDDWPYVERSSLHILDAVAAHVVIAPLASPHLNIFRKFILADVTYVARDWSLEVFQWMAIFTCSLWFIGGGIPHVSCLHALRVRARSMHAD